MMISIGSITFLVAVTCAALMGYAIQRGATCMVAAVAEIVREGKANRLLAMGETALWVAGGLLIARAIGLTLDLPAGFATTHWTIIGAMFLGLGALVNGACVFGAIARLGSGEWAYILTPFGYYLGTLSLSSLFPSAMPTSIMATHVVPDWPVIPLIFFAAWRLFALMRAPHKSAKIWAPHEATIIIGITLVIMLIGVGDWTYMNVLSRLAQGMFDQIYWRLILFVALLSGAVIGGWTAGRLSSQRPTLVSLSRCLVGGVLMGWGSALIPGSNDGLTLIGMPLLMPYAWVGVTVMAAVIWGGLRIAGRITRR